MGRPCLSDQIRHATRPSPHSPRRPALPPAASHAIALLLVVTGDSAPSIQQRPPPDRSGIAELFTRAERIFRGRLQILRTIALAEDRILFHARDEILKRDVTLRIHPRPDSPGRRWFLAETELLAALDHPSIRPVYAAGQEGEWAYRLSKWVEGENLAEAVQRGPRPIPVVVDVARDLLGALEYAHAEGIVLRRILPETLLLHRTHRAFITDLRYANPCLPLVHESQIETGLPYLAPEARGRKPGEPTSDIYTAGALLYFAITGRHPTLDPRATPPPMELRPACPRAVDRVIMRALHHEPEQRYLTAAEMGDDLASDLGDFDVPITVAPALRAGTEDARSWEKRLRRALGDDYELLDELGVGGFGRVYLVRDLRLERDVALKLLHPYFTVDQAIVERFHREAQLAASLSHPNIVSIYDINGRAGLFWYTMAYVPGYSLTHRVQEGGPLSVTDAARLLDQALGALAHAHERDVVHRDIKPENVLLDGSDGSVRIADFGLALAFRGSQWYVGASSQAGTPEFAAPELLLGESVDERTDLFSLTAATLFAITGRPPWGSGPAESIAARQTVEGLPDIRRDYPHVPPPLAQILTRGAARFPEDRFPDARAYRALLASAMQQYEASETVPPARVEPPGWIRRLFGRGWG